MAKLTHSKVTAVAAAFLVAGAAFGTATASASSPMPLSSKWRACDFSQQWVPAVGDARALAFVGPAGDGSMVAKVDLATALPNTRYDVRVVQAPRPSIGCAPGQPGVLNGSLQTDGVGAGSVTLQGPVESGKTGAWVIVERPAPNSQTPAEFYTSEFIATI
jgi:hypothetical protein